MNRDDLDDDARDNDVTDNDQVPEEYQNMSEMEMEGFLADAIEGYANDQGIPNVWTVPFSRAGLLTRDRGLVIRIAENEYQVRILRTD
jgi:hypothetical protein